MDMVRCLNTLLSDFNKLETKDIEHFTEQQSYLFYGTIAFVIADNFASHALGGIF